MKTYHKDEDGNILMHSDTYLGEDYISANLCHWRYLKKVKSPSGKWRYIYDDSEMKAQEKIYKDIDNKINSKDGYEYYDKNGTLHIHDRNGNATLTTGGYNKYIDSKQSIEDKLKESRFKSYKKYKSQRLKDFPKRVISKGIGFFNKLILNIEKSWIK